MGWLHNTIWTRSSLIGELTKEKEKDTGEMVVKTVSLKHCYRGGAGAGVLWGVWERTFTKDGVDVQPAERWITCDMMQYNRTYGWGYKDMAEACGPHYFSCPMSYLEMVPEVTNAAWRYQVIAQFKRNKEKRLKKKLSMAG